MDFEVYSLKNSKSSDFLQSKLFKPEPLVEAICKGL